MLSSRRNSIRRGTVYIAVLGTALVISAMALSAIALQRIQNRMLAASGDIRQAQLNAEAAIELGLLDMKQNANWRSSHSSGRWFTSRTTGVGACSLDVVDPLDADLADDPSEPFIMTGIGLSGKAEQRVRLTVDQRTRPLSCLRSAIAAGDAIGVTGSVLRATNSGLVSANSTSASSSTVSGKVEAVSVSGSTYVGTTTQIDPSQRPQMPDWSTVFDYYLANGTEISIINVPQTTPNLGRNVGFEIGGSPPLHWTGAPPNVPTATITQSTAAVRSGTYSLRVSSRTEWWSGAAQYIDHFVKPNQQYNIEAWLYLPGSTPGAYYFTIYTKGTGSSSVNIDSGGTTFVPIGTWTRLSGTVTAQSWSGALEYAFVKIASSGSGTATFHIDDFDVREATSGRFIYRQALGPGVNPFFPYTTNAQGIYWINCAGNKLIIERSRIRGTLLLLNPGSGSCIGAGPIHWSPAVVGYPALMVRADTATDADLTIAATNRMLSETENGVNYNPPGASHEDLGQDVDTNDIYPSEIQGLVVVGDDLTAQNNTLIRGQVVVGDDLSMSGGSLEVVYRPDSLLTPPPGFRASPAYVPRPSSVQKTVVP